MQAEINISRLNYLLELYKLKKEDFLNLISEGLKKPILADDIFADNISLNHLKRIDKIFNKGLSFYVDPSDLVSSNDASIFFRKREFASDLNFGSRKIVNEFEELKLSLSAISKAADIESPRVLPIFTAKDNPVSVAKKIRGEINFSFRKHQKTFLEHLINKLGECNILVFEFVESWNQRNKANIDGVFLAPNVIVLKRLDGFSYSRELFTLAHELGHYLLNIEEVEKIDFDVWSGNLSDVEKWCNSFAFHFLIGDLYSEFSSMPIAGPNNDYNHEIIQDISDRTNLSRLALYTQLLMDKKISSHNYSKVKSELEKEHKDYFEAVKRKREEDKNNGIEVYGSSPTPIKSEFLISLVRTAYYEGAINEFQVCKALKIQPNNLPRYISVQ